MAAIAFPTMLEFQSTLPVRGATAETGVHALAKGISIHAPREGSDQMRQTVENLAKISIHAPREGSDGVSKNCMSATENFNPRSP